MTQDQLLSLVRTLLQIAGTSLVARGVLSAADWTTIMGAVLMVVPVIWGMLAHSQTGTVAAVAKLAKNPDSPVKGVIMTNNAAGQDLAAAIPAPAAVVAGSLAAAAIAR